MGDGVEGVVVGGVKKQASRLGVWRDIDFSLKTPMFPKKEKISQLPE